MVYMTGQKLSQTQLSLLKSAAEFNNAIPLIQY